MNMIDKASELLNSRSIALEVELLNEMQDANLALVILNAASLRIVKNMAIASNSSPESKEAFQDFIKTVTDTFSRTVMELSTADWSREYEAWMKYEAATSKDTVH